MNNKSYYEKKLETEMKKLYSYSRVDDDISDYWDDECECEEKKTDPRQERINQLQQRLDSTTARANETERVLHELTDGNEAAQRILIQQDPKNIKYIEVPYVSIQIEAITANLEVFHLIKNPAQEAIDTYKIIK
jgi:hypothetical protein